MSYHMDRILNHICCFQMWNRLDASFETKLISLLFTALCIFSQCESCLALNIYFRSRFRIPSTLSLCCHKQQHQHNNFIAVFKCTFSSNYGLNSSERHGIIALGTHPMSEDVKFWIQTWVSMFAHFYHIFPKMCLVIHKLQYFNEIICLRSSSVLNWTVDPYTPNA